MIVSLEEKEFRYELVPGSVREHSHPDVDIIAFDITGLIGEIKMIIPVTSINHQSSESSDTSLIKRILVVDDNSDVALAVRMGLETNDARMH